MRLFSVIIFFIFFLFCQSPAEPASGQPVRLRYSDSSLPDSLDYTAIKKLIVHYRDSIKKVYREAGTEERKAILLNNRNFFSSLVMDKLVPCWYGTPWDFNGITEKPGEGQIACGYFITTVLRDAGVTINRYKVAQLAAADIIKKLADKNSIRSFRLKTADEVVDTIRSSGPGLYIAGLDYHVGFLYNDGKEVYFIHSNYVQREGVVKEKAIASAAFAHSQFRITGKISTGDFLLKSWLGL